MNSSEELKNKLKSALEEMLAMGYIAYQTGNFNKAEGLLTAAKLISKTLGEDCYPELLDRYNELNEMIQSTQTSCDWVI